MGAIQTLIRIVSASIVFSLLSTGVTRQSDETSLSGVRINHPENRPSQILNPDNYPPDPTGDTNWSGSYSSVLDIQNSFNAARSAENGQLGKSYPMMTLPTQSEWNAMSDGQKALWLINRERIDREVMPLTGLETNVTGVAQTYASYLFNNNAWGHEEDGRSPWQRLSDNPAIGACQDFLSVAENLAVFVTSGNSISMPIERSVFNWMYDDSGSAWGHRHAILWYPYNNNGGPADSEGFLGIGRASGGPYQGPFSSPWNYAELIVMDVFDPCAAWNYGTTTYSISGHISINTGGDLPGVYVSAGAAGSTNTDLNGNYTISGLAAGDYTLTPSTSGYTFSPPSRSVSISTSNVSGQDFTATLFTGTYHKIYLPGVLNGWGTIK